MHAHSHTHTRTVHFLNETIKIITIEKQNEVRQKESVPFFFICLPLRGIVKLRCVALSRKYDSSFNRESRMLIKNMQNRTTRKER